MLCGGLAYLVAGIYLIAILVSESHNDSSPILMWMRIGLPVILFFSIGTSLFRHDAKLRQRYEHLSNKKHLLEKTTGVLSAAKELSLIKDVDERYPLIIQTFKTASRHLIGEIDSGLEGVDDNQGVKDVERTLVNTGIKEAVKKIPSP